MAYREDLIGAAGIAMFATGTILLWGLGVALVVVGGIAMAIAALLAVATKEAGG